MTKAKRVKDNPDYMRDVMRKRRAAEPSKPNAWQDFESALSKLDKPQQPRKIAK